MPEVFALCDAKLRWARACTDFTGTACTSLLGGGISDRAK